MALDSTALEWKPVEHSGPGSVEAKQLFSDSRYHRECVCPSPSQDRASKQC